MDAFERALDAGKRAFGPSWRPNRMAKAPGRLELLGNHVDYSGGPVLAAAIDRSTVVLFDDARRGDQISVAMADVADFDRASLKLDDLTDWRNASPPPEPLDYVRGAIAVSSADSAKLSLPSKIAVAGDVPIGFGLSSSAALCVALSLAFCEKRPDDRTLVLAAQEAEHRAGTPCGTMDQFASVAGGVILYDGTTLTAQRLQPDLGAFVFAVVDSGVRRQLGASSYPVRVEEAKQILAIAKRVLDPSLPNPAAINRDGLNELLALDSAILAPTLAKRITHIVSEIERVHAGLAAMHGNDWPSFGRLMTASGQSSAHDYEISHPRVEELVAEALELETVLGARMMGGGEGGTALVLLPRAAVPELVDRLSQGYLARYGMDANFAVHIFGFAAGAQVVPLA